MDHFEVVGHLNVWLGGVYKII